MSRQSLFPPLYAHTSLKKKEKILPSANAATVSEALRVHNARSEAPIASLSRSKLKKINKQRCSLIALHRAKLAQVGSLLPDTRDKLRRVHALMSHPALNGEHVDTIAFVYASSHGYSVKAYTRAFKAYQRRLMECIKLHS
jgi:hypothetical protein